MRLRGRSIAVRLGHRCRADGCRASDMEGLRPTLRAPAATAALVPEPPRGVLSHPSARRERGDPMTAGKHASLTRSREMTMAVRVLLLAMIAAAALAMAAPALAFNGLRSDYTTAAECQVCHAEKHAQWSTTSHSSIEGNLVPIHDGPRCAGCHTGNYEPRKAVPASGTGTRSRSVPVPQRGRRRQRRLLRGHGRLFRLPLRRRRSHDRDPACGPFQRAGERRHLRPVPRDRELLQTAEQRILPGQPTSGRRP